MKNQCRHTTTANIEKSNISKKNKTVNLNTNNNNNNNNNSKKKNREHKKKKWDKQKNNQIHKRYLNGQLDSKGYIINNNNNNNNNNNYYNAVANKEDTALSINSRLILSTTILTIFFSLFFTLVLSENLSNFIFWEFIWIIIGYITCSIAVVIMEGICYERDVSFLKQNWPILYFPTATILFLIIYTSLLLDSTTNKILCPFYDRLQHIYTEKFKNSNQKNNADYATPLNNINLKNIRFPYKQYVEYRDFVTNMEDIDLSMPYTKIKFRLINTILFIDHCDNPGREKKNKHISDIPFSSFSSSSSNYTEDNNKEESLNNNQKDDKDSSDKNNSILTPDVNTPDIIDIDDLTDCKEETVIITTTTTTTTSSTTTSTTSTTSTTPTTTTITTHHGWFNLTARILLLKILLLVCFILYSTSRAIILILKSIWTLVTSGKIN